MRIIPLPEVPSRSPSPTSTPSSGSQSSGSSPQTSRSSSSEHLTVPRLEAMLTGRARLPIVPGMGIVFPEAPGMPTMRRTRPRLAPRTEPLNALHYARHPAHNLPECPFPEPGDMARQFPFMNKQKLAAYAHAYNELVIASLTYGAAAQSRLEYWQYNYELKNLYEDALPPPPYSP